MVPDVTEKYITATAGQPLSVESNFMIVPNLVTDPTFEWLNWTGSVVSRVSTLSLSPLRTSDGGKYTFRVTISIIQLNVSLTAEGMIRIFVQSEFSTQFVLLYCPYVLCIYPTQFLLRLS